MQKDDRDMTGKLGVRLRKLRKQYNYTQLDIAKILGLSDTAIANYEIGKRRPEYETLVKLANIYGVTVDYLVGRKLKWKNELPEKLREIALDPENIEWIMLIPYLKEARMKPQVVKNIVKSIVAE